MGCLNVDSLTEKMYTGKKAIIPVFLNELFLEIAYNTNICKNVVMTEI